MFSCDTRIYCSSYDNIRLVFDSSNIVIAQAIYSRITLKAIQYYINIHSLLYMDKKNIKILLDGSETNYIFFLQVMVETNPDEE